MAGATSTVRLLFLGDASSAMRASRQASAGIAGVGKSASITGKVMKGMALGVVGGLAASAMAAVKFDKAMRNVNSIARLSETQFKKLSKQVLELAKTTGQGPSTLADGLYDIVSSGFKASQGLKILKASAIAATAGLTDTATSTKAIVAVLNAYHLSASDAAKVSDIMFQTVNKGVLTFEELAGQIGDVLPVASQLGIPLEDVGGAMATITLHGVNAAEAATQLKQTFVSFLKPSKELEATLKGLGYESGEAALKQAGLEKLMRQLTTAAAGSGAAFANWFPNVRAMNGALGISGKNVKTLHDNIEAMNKSQGAAGAAFAEQSKSISVQWQRVKASLTAAAIPIGQALFPVLEALIDKVGQFATKLSDWGPSIRAVAGDFGSILGPALSTVGAGLQTIVASSSGRAALSGVVTTLLAAKGLSSVGGTLKGIVGPLSQLGPAGRIAAAGIGLATAAFVAFRNSSSNIPTALREIEEALGDQATAAQGAADAQNLLKRVDAELLGAKTRLRAATIIYNKEVDAGRKKSQAAKDALAAQAMEESNIATLQSDRGKVLALLRDAQGQYGEKIRTTNEKLREAKTRMQDHQQQQRALNAETVRAWQAAGKLAGGQDAAAAALRRLNRATDIGLVQVYAGVLRKADKDLAALAREARNAGNQAAYLVLQMQRMRNRRVMIDIIYNYKTTGNRRGDLPGNARPLPKNVPGAVGQATGGVIHRSEGGHVPGTGAGDTVPALLTPGEVVLNRKQQGKLAKKLGLPDSPHSIFSAVTGMATGGVVRGGVQLFARGGIARGVRLGPTGESGKPRPSSKKKVMSKLAKVDAKLAGWRQLQDDIADAEREYDITVAEFDLSEEEVVVGREDPATGDIIDEIDQGALKQRYGELTAMLKMRRRIKAMLEREMAMMRSLVAEIRNLIQDMQVELAKLKREFAKQKKRAADHMESIKGLQATLDALGSDRSPSAQARRARLNELLAYHRGEYKDAVIQKNKADKGIKKLETEIPEAKTNRRDVLSQLDDQPMDIREAQLAIDEILKEAIGLDRVVAATGGQAGALGGGGDGGDGGGSGGDGGGGGDGGPSERERELMALVGQLRLALGIEAAQLGVLGGAPEGALVPGHHGGGGGKRHHHKASFALGGIVGGPHGAPRMVLAHAGEMILNSGQQMKLGGAANLARTLGFSRFALGGVVPADRFSGGETGSPWGRGGSWSGTINAQPQVNITFDNGMEWLRDFVRIEAVKSSGEISRQIGERANERRRAGRF